MNFTSLIQELGVNEMPEAERDQFVQMAIETLNVRVGLRLANDMSGEQKKLFAKLANDGDENAMQDLEKVFPDFRKVYREETLALKDDLAALL